MSNEFDRLIPTSGLLFWHDAGEAYDDASLVVMPDRSGNSRSLTATSGPTSPTIVAGALNGRPAVAWSGTQNPLTYTGSMTIKHLFIVASYTDATFSASLAGLIGGKTVASGAAILVGAASDTKFYNNAYGGTYKFRRRDVSFAENNQQATMSGVFSIYEVSLETGFNVDGLVLGRDRDNTARKWKGRVTDLIGWNRVIDDAERDAVYEYLALKYLLWRQVSSGLNVWPFQCDWGRSLPSDRPVLVSTTVSGATKERVKGSVKLAVQPQFDTREPEELDAARSFINEHRGVKNFIYRDHAFVPARDYTMRFMSGLNEGKSASYRDHSYSFAAVEV